MKIFFYILFLTHVTASFSIDVERKIVIENNQYFFTSISEENQLATLYTGNITQPLDSGLILALPAGRSFKQPINPFSWDVLNGNFYGINFLTHPMNSKITALKRFPLSSLQPIDSVPVYKVLTESIELNMFTRNDPYLYMIRKSNILNQFFYDAIALNDTSYTMVVTNNGELGVWNYNGDTWKHGDDQNFKSSAYFSLFEFDSKVYLLNAEGFVYLVKKDSLTLVEDKCIDDPLKDVIIIENRDDNTISTIQRNQLDLHKALDKQLALKAVKLF